MAQRQDHFLPKGGLDLVTSPLAMPKGKMISGKNYEPAEGGYRRVGGYERFDGRPAPSAATYSILEFEQGAALAAGSYDPMNPTIDPANATILTGVTSGATAVLLLDPVVESGSVADGDAAGYYVVADVTGTFGDGEVLNDGMSAVGEFGTLIKDADDGDLDDGDLDGEYRTVAEIAEDALAAAAALRRHGIAPVPGSGPVRGVWSYRQGVYAFRDNPAGDAGVMWRASEGGWKEVLPTQQRRLFLKRAARPGEIPARGTRIGSPSGAQGTIDAFVYTEHGLDSDGNISSGKGWLYLSDVTREFVPNELVTRVISGANIDFGVVGDAPSEPVVLAPGGRYDFRNYNFSGAADGLRMYGVNGVSPAFEFDGEILSPIVTGLLLEQETPNHLAIQSNHLLLAYPHGSIQNSATGDPLDWTASNGAAEIATGQVIVGMIEGVGLGNTLILGLNTIQALYGQDKESWELRTHSGAQTGAVEWSEQLMGTPIYLDNRGLRSVDTTERYGNFLIGTLTYYVQPWLEAVRRLGRTPLASTRVRSADLYRLFLDSAEGGSGLGLSVYFGRRKPECSLIEYPHVVRCAYSFEAEQGVERLFFGSDGGWVFEAEKGTSFDGAAIEAFCRLPYNHAGSPSHEIRFHKTNIQIDTPGRSTIRVGADFDYGRSEETSFLGMETAVEGAGDLLEPAIDTENASVAEFHFSGIGANVSLLIQSESAKELPHTLTGITMHYSPRRLRR